MGIMIERLEVRRLLAGIVGTKFPVAATAGVQEGSYGVATDGTNFLVGVEKNHVIGAQLFTAAGAAAAPFASTGRHGDHTVASFGGQPLVAFGGGKYLVVWGDSANATHDIWGAFFTAAGAASGAPFAISSGASEEQTAGVAFDGTKFLVTYLKNADSGNDATKVAGRLVSTTASVGSEIVISTGAGDQALNNVAFDGTNYLVAWVDDTNDSDVRGRFVAKSGTLGTEFSIDNSANASDTPITVGFDGTTYLVAYTELNTGVDFNLFARRVSKAGDVGPELIISAAAGRQMVPFICSDGNNWLVTWNDFRNDLDGDLVPDVGEGTFADIWGRLLNDHDELVGDEFVVNNDAGWQLGGYSAFAGGAYTVGWNDGAGINGVGAFDFADVVGARVTAIPTAFRVGGQLVVNGTGGADSIGVSPSSAFLRADFGNGFVQKFPASAITSISIDAGGGNDVVSIGATVAVNARIDGGDGNDKILGGPGEDTISGGAQ
jgi:hypothetical protein